MLREFAGDEVADDAIDEMEDPIPGWQLEQRIRDLESALRLWVGHADTLVKWTEEELERMPSVRKYLEDVDVARKLLAKPNP
jgi:phage shock protein A